MPIHKELLGDKLRAAKWLPYAMSRLRVMRQWQTASSSYAPAPDVLIHISRTMGDQERIIIKALSGIPGYEFITYIAGEGLYRTHHKYNTKTKKVSSSVLEETRVLSNGDVPNPGDDFGAVHNNPWYKGNTVVTGGFQRRYKSTADTDAVAPIDVPPEVTDFTTGTRVSGPTDMLVNAAAYNNGILVGIDSYGKVYAAEAVSEAASFVTEEPEYPAWVARDGGSLRWSSYWRFNHDGTKAASLMFYEEPNDPHQQVGGIVELDISATRDEEDNLILAVTVEEHALPFGRSVFAVDYYKQGKESILTTAGTIVEIEGEYLIDDPYITRDLWTFLTIETIDGDRLLWELLRFSRVFGPAEDREAYGYFNYISDIDVSRLSFSIYGGSTEGSRSIPYPHTRLASMHIKAVSDTYSKETFTGSLNSDNLALDAVPGDHSQYNHPSTGEWFNATAHGNIFIANVSRATTRSAKSSWGTWQAVNPEDFVTYSEEDVSGLSALELDVVFFGKGFETTHRALYNAVRAEQVAIEHPDPIPPLPELVQEFEQPLNAVPMLNSAWYPRSK